MIEAGERSGGVELDVVAEDGDGACEPLGLGGQAREPQANGANDSFGPDLAHPWRLIGRRGDALSRERGHQLTDEERVPARRREAGVAELGLGFRGECRSHEHGDCRVAQRRWADDEHGRIGDHFRERPILALRLGRAKTRHDQQRQPLEAPDQVAEPAQ